MSRPLVGESNKKQTVREVGCKVNACRTKYQNWIRRSQISYCNSTKSYSVKKLLSKSFHLSGHTLGFHPQSQTIFCSIINSTTGKYCSVSFHLNGHTLGTVTCLGITGNDIVSFIRKSNRKEWSYNPRHSRSFRRHSCQD